MAKPQAEIWHYRPDLPLGTSPCFAWPPRPGAALKWIAAGWLPLSEKLIVLVFALLCWRFLHPSLAQCETLAFDWIALIFLRNLALMVLVAGGLHAYFYMFRIQGDTLRYDRRPFARNSRAFTFNDQVRDNVFWTCASGVPIWSAYEVLMMWAMANGLVPMLVLPQDLGWLILLVLAVPLWETLHFFLIHRLIHWPPFYRRVHALHHRNSNVGPWSGLSMHPLEHVIYLSTVLIHFVVPAHPLLIMFHLMYFTLTAATTHTGYQGLLIRGRLWLKLGTFHHQLHHRYYECNYGGLEIPLDRWTGNFHDGSDESHAAFVARRRRAAN